METAETEDGHEHVTEGPDGDATEEPDVGEPGPGSSPKLCDEGMNSTSAGEEKQSEEAQHEETDAMEVKPEGPESPSQDFKTEASYVEASGSTSEKELTENEREGTGENGVGNAASGKVSAVDDLDEMMDIGTVDQVEQEAQMKDDQESSLTDVDSSCSPGASNAAEEKNPIKEESDEKLSISVTPHSPSHSSDTTSTGRDDSSPALNGMKFVKLSVSQQEAEYVEPQRLSPSLPLVDVKDEPVDEEYDRALTSSAASVKDEPAREDLRIGCFFSVAPTDTLPVVNPSSTQMSCWHCKKGLMKGQTAYQRKGSAALFCSTACLTVGPPPPKATFRAGNRICANCQKLIYRPQDIILAPDAKGVMRDFCRQSCLNSFNSFNFKKNPTSYRKSVTALQPIAPHPLCSMCSRACVSKHEVILSGAVHKICSDACFNRFRLVHNLSMAGCASCSSFCHSKPVMLKMEDSSKTLCNMECLATFKEKTKISQPCTMCQATHPLAEMVDNKNEDDSVNLFCSSSCVMAYKVQTVSSSGARLDCDSCNKNMVPAYHLAMSDTSIRNFCSLPCVMAFQDKFKKTQKQVNIFTKLPVGSLQTQTGGASKTKRDGKTSQQLNCFQCHNYITFKPKIVQIQDQIVFLCSSDCSHEYKKCNYVASVCDYCKVEKITRDVKRINNKDCYFCSDGCKLLYRHDLSKNWGKHCYSCVYCHCASKKLVTAQYGGSTEEFCSEECRSKYTMLFCHVAKCDTCGQKGKLKQSLPLLGEVKHFCDLGCLIQFCSSKAATQGDVLQPSVLCPADADEPTPIIANVVSLASPPAGRSRSSDRLAKKNAIANSQSTPSGEVSVQTETTKVLPAPPPPPPPPLPPHPLLAAAAPKVLKNKALLCKPLVQNKGISCKTQMVDVEAQTENPYPSVIILPVPVPVYVPVPMAMYSQCAPSPMGLPLPVPVPMFLPVTMDSAERVVETIQEIKQKIPSDPYEAELILMAEMVAEQDEKNDKPKAKKPKMEESEAAAAVAAAGCDDDVSNYSDDLDTEDLANFLKNWEDAPGDTAARSPGRPNATEKLHPVPDVPSEPSPEPPASPGPPPGTPPMDIEADLTVETLEAMARLREQPPEPPSPPPPPAGRRRQAHRKAREKRGRKPSRSSSKASEAAPQKGSSTKTAPAEKQKLRTQYGIDAWKRWISWRKSQPHLSRPRYGSRHMELKEDILHCTTAELSYGLCSLVTEVKRPNGAPYHPDSLFYLCLGIQQYLFENGRVENIFMDRFYSKFSNDFTNMLRGFTPSVTASGYIHSRVEEEFLWDCKQLGAYSPIVLLNTLLFFGCKYFGFTTVEQHRQLSFAHLMRCTKVNPDQTKTTFLRFYPPLAITEADADFTVVAAKRRKEEAEDVILEMTENTENPLRCPVRLYEFYLSKCSDSVKQRTNLFYLHPERCCVPNSPLWFSSTPLDDGTLDAMLVRILTVRELHVSRQKKGGATARPTHKEEDEEEEDEDEEEEEEEEEEE